MKTSEFMAALDDSAIADAISKAEKRTSAEIRVFVTERAVENVMEEAGRQFVRLGMNKTELRNGVLIFFAPKVREFAVLGDSGIHKKSGQAFWDAIAAKMAPLLKENRFTDAIVLGVGEIGALLATEFPWTKGDRNELPNEVARDKDTTS
jgi:uncharacterized membrane protein